MHNKKGLYRQGHRSESSNGSTKDLGGRPTYARVYNGGYVFCTKTKGISAHTSLAPPMTNKHALVAIIIKYCAHARTNIENANCREHYKGCPPH